MAKCIKSLISSRWMLPGAIASLIIFGFIALALFTLIRVGISSAADNDIVFDRYLWHIISFSFYQALLSAFCAVGGALFLACAFFRTSFFAKKLLLRLFALIFVLPTIMSILGLTSIYGKSGFIATLCEKLHLDYTFPFYGLSGILIAHVFYNLPFATQLFYQSLEQIDNTQYKLAAQLKLSVWQRFKWIELPVLQRQLPPIFALVFLLCFSSFAIVLTLGGGPQNSTIEVAIFQAFREFNLAQVALLSGIQLLICFTLLLITQKITRNSPSKATQNNTRKPPLQHSFISRFADYALLFIAILFILSPILAIIIEGISALFSHFVADPLANAIKNSFLLSFSAAICSVILAILLLWSAREAIFSSQSKWQHRFILNGKLILAIPSMVIASGLTCFVIYTQPPMSVRYGLIILTQSLLALPFTLKILETPMIDHHQRFFHLISSLRLRGFARFYWLDMKALKTPFLLAFIYAFLIAFGDLGIVMLIGSQEIITLPYLLYQQMASYRLHDAATSALMLLFTSFVLFFIIEKFTSHYDHTQSTSL